MTSGTISREVGRGVVFPIADAMRSVTVNIRVTGVRRMQARLWLATWIFKFGALVAGLNVEISDDGVEK